MIRGCNMYLHEEREDFKDIIEQVVNATGRAGAVVEKDYYVTLILRLLSEKLENVVFKGGTFRMIMWRMVIAWSECWR